MTSTPGPKDELRDKLVELKKKKMINKINMKLYLNEYVPYTS